MGELISRPECGREGEECVYWEKRQGHHAVSGSPLWLDRSVCKRYPEERRRDPHDWCGEHQLFKRWLEESS